VNDGSGSRHIVPLAGENKSSPHPELGYDTSGNKIYFSSIDINTRISVIHQQNSASVQAGDSFVVSFMGTPDAASVVNPVTGSPLLFSANDGIWTERVDVDPQLSDPSAPVVFDKTSPIPVVQVGDTIAGATVTGLSDYDPLGRALDDQAGNPRTPMRGDNMIVFRASTSAGDMIVRGSHLNTSGDGILDHWKTKGIDINQDGTPDLSLAAMGAGDIHKRDLFVEVDWTAPRTSGFPQQWSNAIAPGTGQMLANMYAAAPAEAGGIPAGITLHFDAGAGNSVNMGTDPSLLQGGDQIGQPGSPNTHIDVVYFGTPGSVSVPGLEARSFQDIKNNYFGTADNWARELIFHYAVMADSSGFVDGAGSFGENTPLVLTASGGSSSTLTTAGTSFTAGNLAGHLVKITAGTGAGQIRYITGNTSSQLSIGPNWATAPDNTSVFTLLAGNSGLGELYVKPSPDFNSIPGNDLIISLGGFGVNAGGWLANAKIQERTLAHEIGHNLGLRHNGISNNPNNNPNYHSLMSYAYQLQVPSTVNSYSGAGDPVFNDWANLRMDFQNYDIHLGNTLDLGTGVPPAPDSPEPTIADYQALNSASPDLTPPAVLITAPAPGSVVPTGSALTISLTATDDVQVGSVTVSFDVNGDGIIDASEVVTATSTGPDTYQAVFSSISGPSGARTIEVTAADTSYNYGTATVTVQVSATAPPTVTITPSSASPVYGDTVTFTTTVTPTASGPTPTGTVQFAVDGVSLGGAVTLDNSAIAISPDSGKLSAGPHTITAAYSGDPNYPSNTGTLTLLVSQAPLTVTADNQTKLYGDPVPTLTYTLSGFVPGEDAISAGVTGTAVLTTSATQSSGVGSYTIDIGVGTLAAANYTFSNLVSGSLAVNPAPLTVTADNKSMNHGDTVPALTYTLSGFVLGEDAVAAGVTGSPTFATTGTSSSAAGYYPINVAAGSLAAANYSFTNLVNGILTIKPRVLDVRVDFGSKSMSLIGLGRDLPFINIKAIDVIFSDNVNVSSSMLQLLGVNVPNYSFSTFNYNSSSFDATWGLPSAIAADRLTLGLSGEAAPPNSGSGPNIGADPFSNSFAVLPGDVNGDGVVSGADATTVNNQIHKGYVIWDDVNGDGVIDVTDVTEVRKRIGKRLP
jgi:hypothetical protein